MQNSNYPDIKWLIKTVEQLLIYSFIVLSLQSKKTWSVSLEGYATESHYFLWLQLRKTYADGVLCTFYFFLKSEKWQQEHECPLAVMALEFRSL